MLPGCVRGNGRMRLTTGAIIVTTFVGQVAGMAGFVSFPALQPEFQGLWTLSDSEAGFISGIYFAGYVIAVPLASGLTDGMEARRVYLASLVFGAVGALGWVLRRQRSGDVYRGLHSAAPIRRAAGAERGSPSEAAGNVICRLYLELHRRFEPIVRACGAARECLRLAARVSAAGLGA